MGVTAVQVVSTLQRKIEHAQEIERQRLDADVNHLLQKLLARFNDRDREHKFPTD